jgi:hypothetical protein
LEYTENELDYKSIEHIYPQTARARYWIDRFTNLTASNRDVLKNVIGNLVPLSKPKNSSLSNKSFPEKVSGGSGSSVGFAYGSYAENEVVTLYDEWTPRTILDRSLHILDFVEMRWNLSFGRDSDKISMLGLNFVKPNSRIHARSIGSNDEKSTKPVTKNVKKTPKLA